MSRLTFSLRRRWRNHTGNQGIDPLRILGPRTVEELVEIVRDAERDGCTVRAVGSGHSWSDVALTRGFVILPTGLAAPLELDENLLKAERPKTERLVRVQAGMRIRELNAHLDSLGLHVRAIEMGNERLLLDRTAVPTAVRRSQRRRGESGREVTAIPERLGGVLRG